MLIFNVRDQEYQFGCGLNLTFKDVNQYYGLRKMSLCNVYSKCLRNRFKYNS
jgi:hypothetical protein